MEKSVKPKSEKIVKEKFNRYRDEFTRRRYDGKRVTWRWIEDWRLGYLTKRDCDRQPHLYRNGRWVAVDVKEKW